MMGNVMWGTGITKDWSVYGLLYGLLEWTYASTIYQKGELQYEKFVKVFHHYIGD